MDTAKVGVGETIAAVSAVALFIFMFLPWYSAGDVAGIEAGTFGGSASAWEAFSFVDIVLFLVCVLVVGLVVVQGAESQIDLPRPPAEVMAAVGVVAFVLILLRLIFAPGVDTGGFDVDVELAREIGLFLALIAAAGIAYGGWRATEHEPQPGGPPAATV